MGTAYPYLTGPPNYNRGGKASQFAKQATLNAYYAGEKRKAGERRKKRRAKARRAEPKG